MPLASRLSKVGRNRPHEQPQERFHGFRSAEHARLSSGGSLQHRLAHVNAVSERLNEVADPHESLKVVLREGSVLRRILAFSGRDVDCSAVHLVPGRCSIRRRGGQKCCCFAETRMKHAPGYTPLFQSSVAAQEAVHMERGGCAYVRHRGQHLQILA
eukprot:scaffold475_cov279-Pinguiococcus_pyrenoidosus.AAC.12